MGIVSRKPDLIDMAASTAVQVRGAELALARRARGPVDRWHYVDDPGEPALASPFTNYGGGFNPASFTREPAGVIALRGRLNCPGGDTWSTDAVIFQLPVGYRPAYVETMGAAAAGPVNINPWGNPIIHGFLLDAQITIDTDGMVYGGLGVDGWISLDNLHIRIPA